MMVVVWASGRWKAGRLGALVTNHQHHDAKPIGIDHATRFFLLSSSLLLSYH
jgi:hypothetical protein